MTAEWDEYRRICSRAYLAHIRRVKAEAELAKDAYEDAKSAQDLLKAVRYDRVGQSYSEPDAAFAAHADMVSRRAESLAERMAVLASELERADAVLGALTCHELAPAIVRRHGINREPYHRMTDLNYSEVWMKKIYAAAMVEMYDLLPPEHRGQIPSAI